MNKKTKGMFRTGLSMKMGLSIKMGLALFLMIAVPLSILGSRFYVSSTEVVEKGLINANQKQVQAFNDYYLNSVFGNLDLFVSLWLNEPSLETLFSDSDRMASMVAKWDNALLGYPEVSSVYFASESADFLIAPRADIPKGFNPTNRPWYLAAVASPDQLVWVEPYKDALSDSYIFSVAAAVKNKSGQVIGVMGLDVKLDEMSQLLMDGQSNTKMTMLVTDTKGQVLASTDESWRDQAIDSETWDILQLDAQSFSDIVEVDGVETLISTVTNGYTGWKVIGYIPRADLSPELEPMRKLMWRVIILVTAWATISLSCLYYFNQRVVVRPLKKLMQAMGLAAKGDLRSSVHFSSRDEIGQLFSAFLHMLGKQRHMITAIAESANHLGDQCNEAASVAGHGSSVAFEQLNEIEGMHGDFSLLRESVDQITDQIKKLAQHMEMANYAVQDLGSAASEVANSTVNTSEAVSNMTESLRSLDTQILMVNANAASANEHGLATLVLVDSGNTQLETLLKQLDDIARVSLQLEGVMSSLNESAEQIGDIVETIDDLSEQTNILSLNASIEAARAGEHGKGFAVVANAIGRLAEKSGHATKDIGSILKGTQKQIHRAVQLAHSNTSSIETGSVQMQQTAQAFSAIASAMKESSSHLVAIASATQMQQTATHKILTATEQVNDLAMHVSAASQEQLATIEDLAQTAQQIHGLSVEMAERAARQSEDTHALLEASQRVKVLTNDVSAMSQQIDGLSRGLDSEAMRIRHLTQAFIVEEPRTSTD